VAKKGLLSLATVIWVVAALPMRSFSAGLDGDSGQLIQAARSAYQSGNFAQAGELYTSAIRDLEAAGVSDVRLASSLVGLGEVRGSQGRCGEASDLVLRGIRIIEAAPNSDSFARGEAWETLGKAYDCQHQFSKADLALRRALDAEQSAPAPRPDRLVELLASKGAVYESERNYTAAEATFQRALSFLDQHPRVDSMEAALLLNNLGLLLRLMGRDADSEATFRRGLGLVQAATAPDLGMEVSLRYNLASLDVAHKQFREAAGHFATAARLLDKGAPLPPRVAAQILREYAACLRKLGERRQAKSLDTRSAALLSSQQEGNERLIVDVTELAPPK